PAFVVVVVHAPQHVGGVVQHGGTGGRQQAVDHLAAVPGVPGGKAGDVIVVVVADRQGGIEILGVTDDLVVGPGGTAVVLGGGIDEGFQGGGVYGGIAIVPQPGHDHTAQSV
ncbi:hypothetical protein, partial [Pararcticibacter amylolyticus]|uniref:hypothetical protein n=1 Tax=Pararcticibacter amylolyticus TaxID=2173175 RepID=UPI00192E4FB2